jgi:hypothetical protein
MVDSVPKSRRRFRRLFLFSRLAGALYRTFTEPYRSIEPFKIIIMRIASVSVRTLRWIALVLCLIATGTVASAQTTTFSGTVYSPLGSPTLNPTNPGDPIPNILVFVVNPLYPPPTFSQGQVLGSTCEQQPSLVPAQVLGSALTNYQGSFSFTVTGALPTPNLTLVVQAGKWRRQYTYSTTSLIPGEVNNFPNLAMPPSGGTQSDGSVADLPYIAVVTGSADGIECIFNQIGIDGTKEVGAPGSAAHIQLYPANGASLEGAFPPGGETLKESSLTGTPATLSEYDLVMFGCEGTNNGDEEAGADANNLTGYVNSGGRVFTTHYAYSWLSDNTDFNPAANGWEGGTAPNGTLFPATVNTTNTTSFPEGIVLADWLNYIGALAAGTTPPPYVVNLMQVRINTTSINPAIAVSWANLNSQPAVSMQFTFDTPIGATGTPTVTLAYGNQTAPYLTGDTADTFTVDVTNSSTTVVDNSLQLTITLPTGLTPVGAVDSTTGGSWICNPGSSGFLCNRTTALAAGASDNVLVTVGVSSTAPLGNVAVTASLSGGGLSGSSQCGRVLYNDYHVEEPNSNVNNGSDAGLTYPTECPVQTTLTAVQKFLEFSLYNLSSFISTTSTDTIDIQGLPALAWTTPLPTIPYGTVNYTTTLPTATYASATVAGTYTYTPALNTVLPVGANQQVCATFVPSSAVDYLAVTTPVCSTITVVPDTTTTTISNIASPIFYGQTFNVSTPTVTTAGPASLTEGTVTYTIAGPLGTQTFCSLTYPNGGTCSLPTIYDAGTYTFQACYTDPTGDFANSCSLPYTVVINPDPTTSIVSSSNDPATVGTAVTLTATIGDQYATATGNVTFMDGTTPIYTAPLTTGTTVSYTTSAFIIGQHNITACYAPVIDPSKTYDFLPICSANFIQSVVLVPSAPLGTVTLLNSSANPSIVAQAVTFTAAVATTGTFISTPTGTINFFDASSTTPTTPLNATPTALNPSGYATFTTSTLIAGTHPITAVYSGSTTYAASTSQPLQQVVTNSLAPAGNGFLMQVNPTAISVGVGGTATVSVSIAALNNFNQAVQLTCTGLPTATTCTFAQTMIAVGGGKTTLTISPAAPSACGSGSPDFVAANGRGTLPLLAIGALGLFFVRKRKRLAQGLTLALALCLLPVLNGCSSRCTDFGTQPNTYTLTVTGTAMPATSGTSITQTSTQTIQMNVHL